MQTESVEPSPDYSDPRASNDGDDSARRAVRLACVVVLAIVLAGLAALPVASGSDYTGYSLFYDQYARIELPPLLLAGGFVLALFVARRRDDDGMLDTVDDRLFERFPSTLWLALAAGVAVWLGVRFVFHGYAFTDDEYSAYLESQIFAHGKTYATVPASWCPWVGSITPTSIVDANCTWRLGFLPLHSLFRAPFVALGIDQIGGAITAALSLLLVAAIARKQWPDRPQRAWLAALFFATSTQMLFMSMTFFSMPTHLLFSLAWLWLYVDDRPISLVLLPWVGALALGVHSPFPHGYFALFFLIRYLRDRRFLLCAYVGGVYVLGLLFWQGYLNGLTTAVGTAVALAPVSTTAAVATRLFALPGPEMQLAMAMQMALVVTWNSPVVIALASTAMIRWRKLDPFSRDAAAGIVFVLLARTFLTHTPQGVGWGYRYLHDSLGTLCLLAAVGAETVIAALGVVSTRRLIVAATAATVVFQLPLRSWDVDSVVGPYRRGSEWLASMPENVVIFMPDFMPWGRQLIRNDPFFSKPPVIVDGFRIHMNPPTIDSLRASHGSVHTVTVEEMKAHGLPLKRFRLGRVEIPF